MKKSKKKKRSEREEIRRSLILDRRNPATIKFEERLKVGTTKKHRALKLAFGATLATILVLSYIDIVDAIFNNELPAGDAFTSGNVWDKNDNDLQFDDDGNIIIDAMTDADKQIVKSQIGKLVFQDALSRGQKDLGEIQDIMSINLLPYNLRPENNQDNKYFLSILFRDEKASYTLNYFTGSDFSSEEESLKGIFSDFIDYVNFDCALANCSKMDEFALAAKDALGDQVLHVGKNYAGYMENGERYYYIPVYNSDGTTTIYSAWDQKIDGPDLNPMEEFSKEMSDESDKKLFRVTDFVPSESLQKVMQILQQSKTQSSQSTEEIE